ncbi:GNAT family N-acetyltransferase [Arthrobacter sp. NPDC090010]|uniref:GNAT family N-acetyltransferase n=1 Tax=Arthrobacter sp. NPDC090010 TaxID=3363942 RepID=UPI0037F870E4
MLSLEEIFPPFGLVLRTPRLELRVLRDEDMAPLIEAVRSGIHEPGKSPFSVPWSEAPAEQLPANTARFHWSTRSGFAQERWELAFGIWHEGELIGSQSLMATDFAAFKVVKSGSWIRKSSQGQGLGKEMRAAILIYAFDFLGADVAESSAAVWNQPSLGVSHSLGYRDNGVHREPSAEGPAEIQQLRLNAADFRRPDWQLSVAGHEPLARFIGLDPAH